MQRIFKSLFLPLLMLWLFIVIAFYYWGHQFALIPAVIGILRILWQLGICCLLGIATYGLGVLPSKFLRLKYYSRAEEVVFILGLGFGLLSLITLGLSFAGLVRSSTLWILCLILAMPTLVWVFRKRQTPYSQKSGEHQSLERFDYFLLAFIGAILIIGLFLALAPPIAWDGLSTHLVLVRNILENNGLRPSPYTDRPIVGHLIFVWGLALGGDTLPQIISYAQGVLMVVAVAEFSRQHFGRRTAILAAAILCSIEVFVITATWPYVDIPVGFFGLLAILALTKWQLGYQDGKAWLIITFIFGVFAAHTKLNGLFVYPALATGIILGLWWRRQNLRNRLGEVAIAFIIGFLLAAVWTLVEQDLQEYAGTAVTQLADTTLLTAGEIATPENLMARFGRFVTVIWEMTIIGQQGGLNYDGTISPLFLIIIPALVIIPRKSRIVLALLLATLVEFAAWLLVPKGYYQNRHLILTYPLLSILTAFFISRLPEFDRKYFSISGFFKVVIILVLVIQFIFLLSWYQALDPSAYLLGLEDRDQYLADNLNGGSSPGYYDMMRTMNDQLPSNSTVGVAWPEPRIFYCQMNCVRYVFPRSAGPEQMAEIARNESLTHLLISEQGLDYWLDFNQDQAVVHQQLLDYRAALKEFTIQYGMLEHNEKNSFYLYRLELEE